VKPSAATTKGIGEEVNKYLRRLPKALLMGTIATTYFLVRPPDSALDVGEEVDEDEDLGPDYITTGLLTAGVAVAKAHSEGRNCDPHHYAEAVMLRSINDADVAIMVIQNLVQVASASIDEDEVASIVRSIVETELDED